MLLGHRPLLQVMAAVYHIAGYRPRNGSPAYWPMQWRQRLGSGPFQGVLDCSPAVTVPLPRFLHGSAFCAALSCGVTDFVLLPAGDQLAVAAKPSTFCSGHYDLPISGLAALCGFAIELPFGKPRKKP